MIGATTTSTDKRLARSFDFMIGITRADLTRPVFYEKFALRLRIFQRLRRLYDNGDYVPPGLSRGR